MAYDSVNKVVNAPVSIYDVQRCLAKSSNDLGTLCTANNINPWSKHKPVKYPTLGVVSETALKSINYGLNIVAESNYLDAYNNGILYNIPTGKLESPYRIHDFDKYNHVAGAPFSAMLDIDVSKLNTDICRIDFLYNHGGGDYLIGVSDLISTNIGALYLAVILSDGTNTYIKTSPANIDNEAIYIEFPIKSGYLQNYEGTLNAKIVLCSSYIANLSLLSSITGNTYYPLLVSKVSDAMCNIKISSSFNLIMLAESISTNVSTLYSNIENFISTPANLDAFNFASSTGSLYLKISVTNNSSKAVNVGNHFSLRAMASLSGTTSGIVACQLYNNAYAAVDSITIAANSTTTFVIGSSNILFMNNGLVTTPTESVQKQCTLTPYYNGTLVNVAIDGPINIIY